MLTPLKTRKFELSNGTRACRRFTLPPDQHEALIKLDVPSIVKMAAHPLVPFLAQMQRLRPGR